MREGTVGTVQEEEEKKGCFEKVFGKSWSCVTLTHVSAAFATAITQSPDDSYGMSFSNRQHEIQDRIQLKIIADCIWKLLNDAGPFFPLLHVRKGAGKRTTRMGMQEYKCDWEREVRREKALRRKAGVHPWAKMGACLRTAGRRFVLNKLTLSAWRSPLNVKQLIFWRLLCVSEVHLLECVCTCVWGGVI